MEVATVHRFQGSEKDLVIFDLVDGPPIRSLHRFFADEDGMRLLNVACSRARGKLVFVGHGGYFADALSRSRNTKGLGHILQRAWKSGHHVDATTLWEHAGWLAQLDMDGVGGHGSPSGRPSGFWNADTFFPAFAADLHRGTSCWSARSWRRIGLLNLLLRWFPHGTRCAGRGHHAPAHNP